MDGQGPAPVPPVVTPSPSTGPSTTNGLAIAALIVGIVAVISGWAPFWGVIVGAAAVVLGVLGLKKPGGRGMSIAGIITGAIGAVWSLIVTVLFVIALSIGGAVVQTAQNAVDQANNESNALINAKKDFAKGETAKFADAYEVTITSVQRNYNPGQYYTAADGKEYVKLGLSIKNISDESQYVSSFTFNVLDKGVAKSSSFAPVDNELESGDLEAGATTKGNVVYEVTKGASDLKLVYKTTVSTYDTDRGYQSKELSYTLAF